MKMFNETHKPGTWRNNQKNIFELCYVLFLINDQNEKQQKLALEFSKSSFLILIANVNCGGQKL